MKHPVIFNFRRDAEHLVRAIEEAVISRALRTGERLPLRLFIRPYADRRRTERLRVFAEVRCGQLLAAYEDAEANILELIDRLQAARDHHARVGRVLDLWTNRYAEAAALYVDAHEPALAPVVADDDEGRAA